MYLQLGVMAHEIGHTLGLYHEQSRPDRDKYITINYGNIKGNPVVNFASKNWRFVRTLGIPYDYSSAMHYGSFVSTLPKGFDFCLSVCHQLYHGAMRDFLRTDSHGSRIDSSVFSSYEKEYISLVIFA